MTDLTKITWTNGAVDPATSGDVQTVNALTALIGNLTDAAVIDPNSASAALLPLIRGLLQKFIDGIIASGQTTASGSISVVRASDAEPAHDAADSGIGTKQAFKAIAGVSSAAVVSAADRTDAYAGIDGVQYVRPHCGLEDIVTSGLVTCTAGANTSAISGLGSGVKFYLMAVHITGDGVNTGSMIITDGNGGTTKDKIPFSPAGAVVHLPVPVPFSANTAVYVDPTGSNDIGVVLIGFKSKV